MKKYLKYLIPVFLTIAKCLLYSPYYVTTYSLFNENGGLQHTYTSTVRHTYTSVPMAWVRQVIAEALGGGKCVYSLDIKRFVVEAVITFVIATALAFLIRFIWNLLRARKGEKK